MLIAADVAKRFSDKFKGYCRNKSRRGHLSVDSNTPVSSKTSILLTTLLVYLVASRLGPCVHSVGVSLASQYLLQDNSYVWKILPVIKAGTRPPSLLTSTPDSHNYSPLTLTVSLYLMGNKTSKTKPTSSEKAEEQPQPTEQPQSKEESQSDPVTSPSSQPSNEENYEFDAEGRIKKKQSSDSLMELERAKEEGRRDSTQSDPGTSHSHKSEAVVKFVHIEGSLKTGDLALLYRTEDEVPHFGIFIDHSHCDPHFPLLLIKGKTKPLPIQHFNRNQRDVRVITAVTRIFYGDYHKVAIRRLQTKQNISCGQAMEAAQKVESIPYTQQELMMIEEAATPGERSKIMCAFNLAHVYKEMGVLIHKPTDIRPNVFMDALPLGDAVRIKLPPVKPGPLVSGDAPLLAQLAEGIRPLPDVDLVSYGKIRDELQTGDLVLFSGATSSGAIIKIFDGALFSHVGVIIRPRYSSHLMVWEASTNKAGLVDIDSGSVRKGVELLPLRNKIFSGWYNHVAIRRLTGLTDKQRSELYDKLLELRKNLQGRPYEKNNIELILSAVDLDEKYLTFLKNDHEDLSSLFCSELVAHVYQELGLISKTKLSNEYTPDDFASHRDLPMLIGKLEKEQYIELKFDYDKDIFRQTSISATQAATVH